VKNTARAVKDDNGEVICYEGSLEDITLRKSAQDALEQANEGLRSRLAEIADLQVQLREQAVRDHLTTLFNRRYLEETLVQELAKAERKNYPVSLIMLDIDYFKRINDTYGHKAGDQALGSLGGFILSSIRRSDIACRFGGDEFVIVMPEAPLSLAYERAEALRRGVQDRVRINNEITESVTVSEGIAAYPVNGATGEEVLRAADQALFAAKAGGRNRVVVASDLTKTSK
jgi:diguanylate cyclase (GGDEF)-like protein